MNEDPSNRPAPGAPPPRRGRGRRPTPTAILFLVFISLPALDAALRFLPRPAMTENRALAPRPRFRPAEWESFPRAASDFVNDHFGGRGVLIRWDARLKIGLLRVSPNPAVVIGADGWLYLGQEDKNRNVMDYSRGLRPFTQGELVHFRETLLARWRWLKDRGIVYLFVLTPDKSTVYPEHLPAGLRSGLRPNRRVQWLRFMRRTRAGLPVLDLSSPLARAGATEPVFMKTDSHWDDFGIWIGYREILLRLAADFPALAPRELVDFVRRDRTGPGGDLAGMINARDLLLERTVRLEPRRPPSARPASLPARAREGAVLSATENPDRGLPRAVMFMDSFGFGLADLLAEHFSRLVTVRDRELRFDPDLVAAEKPDVVIEEINERFLLGWAPVNPPSIRR